MPDGAQQSLWQGLISGLGYPLLAPDHLLFLLALGLVGFSRPRRSLLPMLIVGLGGSAGPVADSVGRKVW